MNRWTVSLFVALAAVGCGPAMAAPDAAADACVTATSVEACVAIVDAVCARTLECCGVSPRPSNCPSWTTVRECRTALAASTPDLDCATASGQPVCRDRLATCTAMYRPLACADLLNGTAHVNCR